MQLHLRRLPPRRLSKRRSNFFDISFVCVFKICVLSLLETPITLCGALFASLRDVVSTALVFFAFVCGRVFINRDLFPFLVLLSRALFLYCLSMAAICIVFPLEDALIFLRAFFSSILFPHSVCVFLLVNPRS